MSGSVFKKHELTHISLNFKNSYCDLKITGVIAKACVAFSYFNVERSYDALKSKMLFSDELKLAKEGRVLFCNV